MFIAVQGSAVHCSAVQCSTMKRSAVQFSEVQYSAVEYSAVQCSVVQYSMIQWSAVLYCHYRNHRIGEWYITSIKPLYTWSPPTKPSLSCENRAIFCYLMLPEFQEMEGHGNIADSQYTILMSNKCLMVSVMVVFLGKQIIFFMTFLNMPTVKRSNHKSSINL